MARKTKRSKTVEATTVGQPEATETKIEQPAQPPVAEPVVATAQPPVPPTEGSFGSLMSNIVPTEIPDQEEPAFTVADLTGNITMLTRMVRWIFIKTGMSWARFDSEFRDTAMRSAQASNQANYSRYNLRRALKVDRVTWENVEKWLAQSPWQMIDFAITLKDPEGRIVTFKISEADRAIQQYDMERVALGKDEVIK